MHGDIGRAIVIRHRMHEAIEPIGYYAVAHHNNAYAADAAFIMVGNALLIGDIIKSA